MLNEVATSKSLPALEKASQHKTRSLAILAKSAVDSVKEREAKKK